METDPSPAPTGRPLQGGTIESVFRERPTGAQALPTRQTTGERYELRDPFAEVTYRTTSLSDVVAKADQLGSNRFIAIAEDGQRTPVQKVGDEWQLGQLRLASQNRPQDDRSDAIDPPQLTPASPTASHGARAHPDQSAAEATARIEAQTERAALVARLEAGLLDRYIIKQAPANLGDLKIGRMEYRFRGDTSRVAFTESNFRLATDVNSPSVARSMVDVAEARDWKALRVSGHEDFKRMVWLEANVRGVKTVGYEPAPADLEVLKREREARQVNRIEPAREASTNTAATQAEKPSARGSGGRKAVLAAIEAVLVDKKLPQKQREAVMAAATEKLAQRMRDGQVARIKVYDKTAPSQRQLAVPQPEQQRSRERSAPAPAR